VTPEMFEAVFREIKDEMKDQVKTDNEDLFMRTTNIGQILSIIKDSEQVELYVTKQMFSSLLHGPSSSFVTSLAIGIEVGRRIAMCEALERQAKL
jgi:hypothetical protein